MPKPINEQKAAEQDRLTKEDVARAHARVLVQKPGYQTFTRRKVEIPLTNVSMNDALPDIYFVNPHINVDQQARIQIPVKGVTDDGKEFYYAKAKNRNGTYSNARVYIVDEIPKSKLEFREKGILSSVIEDYQYLTAKEGGAQIQQGIGGQYDLLYVKRPPDDNPAAVENMDVLKQTILFKQDKKGPVIHHSKNIIEYVAGRIMNFFGGESIATVFYGSYIGGTDNARLPLPDKSGNNIYIGSLYYDGFQDLYKDVMRINGESLHHPKLAFNPTFKANPQVLKDRPKFAGSFNKAAFIKGTVDPESGEARFDNFETPIACSLLVGDYDVHAGNIGVNAPRSNVSNPRDPLDVSDFLRDGSGEIQLNANGKIGVAVKIDHGAAMEKLEDDVHMHGYRSPLTSKGLRPTNHFREYFRDLKISAPFAHEIDRMASMDFAKLDAVIDDAMKETEKFYGAKPISEFAERIGVKLDPKLKKTIAAFDGNQSNAKDEAAKTEVVNQVKTFLKDKMRKRMESMKHLALDIKMSLCIKKVSPTEYTLISPDEPPPPPFNIKTLIAENPAYFIKRFQNNDFHLRKEDQKTVLKMFSNLKSLPMQATMDAAWRVLRGALGEKKIENDASYSMSFYRSEPHKGQQSMLLPKGVTHIRITKKVLQSEFPELYEAQKNKAPALSADVDPKNTQLDVNEYGINYLDNTTREGERCCYIEQLTKDNKYQITAHTPPPEVNPRYVFSDLVRAYCGEDFISVNPSIFTEIKNICAKIDVREMNNDNKFGIVNADNTKTMDEQDVLLAVILPKIAAKIADNDPDRDAKINAGIDQFVQGMKIAYTKATSDQLTMPNGTVITMPSKAYLEQAKAMCDQFVLRNGRNTIIEIAPEGDGKPAKDPMLALALKVICKKSAYRFNDTSGCNLLKGDQLIFAAKAAKDILKDNDAPGPRPRAATH